MHTDDRVCRFDEHTSLEVLDADRRWLVYFDSVHELPLSSLLSVDFDDNMFQLGMPLRYLSGHQRPEDDPVPDAGGDGQNQGAAAGLRSISAESY